MELSLSQAKPIPFQVESTDRLSFAIQRLSQGGIQLVLLDLMLPDSEGLDTFLKVRAQAAVPVVVLTGVADEGMAVKAVHSGAQDYLVKGQVTQELLVRALRYAVERHGLQEELRSLSLVDDLTGLNNRRGFLTLAKQQIKLADRTKRALLVLFADLDRMKWINDTFGHLEGDSALIEVGTIFKETFRYSDIVARYGGDEFATMAIEYTAETDELLISRLKRNLDIHNARPNRRYKLSLSVGTARYDPNQPISMEDLLAKADAAMYEQKRKST